MFFNFIDILVMMGDMTIMEFLPSAPISAILQICLRFD